MKPSHFINGQWIEGNGEVFTSTNPATGETVWQGRAATAKVVELAVAAARNAQDEWASKILSDRVTILEKFASILRERQNYLAEAISLEVGKPRWESAEEVAAMIGKVALSIQAYNERRNPTASESADVTLALRYRPHGVVAVFGPFNFPGHLPNGHIVPALLAGNAVVFKPSEITPLVAQRTIEACESAGLPSGVINLVQGAKETGVALSKHPGLDGIFFTGSVAVGQALNKTLASQPNKILALELGGNNPLIVSDAIENVDAAAYLTIQSAYLTAGQRCTCARRLIVPAGASGDKFIEHLAKMTGKIRVGAFTENPEPFMGPVISESAADKLLATQEDLRKRGGVEIVSMKLLGPRRAMLSPGLIDVTAVANREDVEHFGPLLQIIRVKDFAAAIREANNTAYGLSAGLLSDNRDEFELFARTIRAGAISWNRPTTGASGKLPFGGIGLSGNHRPSGYWAADYCSYPVASLESSTLQLPAKRLPGIDI